MMNAASLIRSSTSGLVRNTLSHTLKPKFSPCTVRPSSRFSSSSNDPSNKDPNNIGKFHWETYINGSRISPHWVDTKHAARFSPIEGLNFSESTKVNVTTPHGLDGEVIALQLDASASVILVPPQGYIEDKISAGKYGITQFLHKKSGDVSSAFSVCFREHEKDTEEITVSKYVEMKKVQFWSSNPYGMVSDVRLSDEATAHIRKSATSKRSSKSQVSLSAVLFDVKGLEPRSGQLMLVIRTPGGFWEISWHSAIDDIYSNKSLLEEMLSNLSVAINKETLAPIVRKKSNKSRGIPASELLPVSGSTRVPATGVLSPTATAAISSQTTTVNVVSVDTTDKSS